MTKLERRRIEYQRKRRTTTVVRAFVAALVVVGVIAWVAVLMG